MSEPRKTGDAIAFNVESQGGPVVNRGWIDRCSDDIVVATFDMKSKHCSLMAEGSNGSIPTILISGEHAIQLNPGTEDQLTEISFPELAGWEIHCAQIARYSLYLCFIKR